ncbi:ABC transporter transmembrane domain-containing protein [Actinokineospora fastidiosa]|uniref:ABC transporter transmembrane domain-containing protein n=1 Tax=Actinokineospora fastidiosa TaxID=1816 RepID=UPI0016716386|nr:ABC transporter ATP-binding protein [Actinokineospora fastidiosa]
MFGTVWMVTLALMPALVGETINRAFARGDEPDLGAAGLGCAGILALGVVHHLSGTLRHRFSESSARTAGIRTILVLTRKIAALGSALPAHADTSAVVSVVTADIVPIGDFVRMAGRAVGALVSFVTVGGLLLGTSLPLGIIVLVGMPALTLSVGPLLRPLHRRQDAHRAVLSDLGKHTVDLAYGLRVLRGIGAERVFARRYREHSQRARAAGERLARVETLADLAQVLLPGLFTVLTLWLAARLAFAGTIAPGDLVTLYGLAGFLVLPIQTATELVDKTAKGLVAARRVVDLLAAPPGGPAEGLPVPGRPSAGGVELADPASGLVARSGEMTVVRVDDTEAGADLADRIGGYTESAVTLRGVPVTRLATPALRRTVLVVDSRTELFAGVLRDELDPGGRHDDARIRAVLDAVCATDIIDALPEGVNSRIGPRGYAFSGGQRHRLVLARALLTDVDVLVLVEPTCAVDAHTEAEMARRLSQVRGGATVVVVTSGRAFDTFADAVLRQSDGTGMEADR